VPRPLLEGSQLKAGKKEWVTLSAPNRCLSNHSGSLMGSNAKQRCDPFGETTSKLSITVLRILRPL
jgi:hypothetical protein